MPSGPPRVTATVPGGFAWAAPGARLPLPRCQGSAPRPRQSRFSCAVPILPQPRESCDGTAQPAGSGRQRCSHARWRESPLPPGGLQSRHGGGQGHTPGVFRTGLLFPCGITAGGVLARKGGAPRLGEAGTAEGVPPRARAQPSSAALGSPLQLGTASSEIPLPSLQPCCCCWRPAPDLCPVLRQREGRWGGPKTAGVIPGQGHHPLPARHCGKG